MLIHPEYGTLGLEQELPSDRDTPTPTQRTFPFHQPAATPQIPDAMRTTKVPDLSPTGFCTVTLLISSVGFNPDLNPLHVIKGCKNRSVAAKQ